MKAEGWYHVIDNPTGDLAPLDDPCYDPEHKPVDGRVPDVVAKFGKRSQLPWFARFRGSLGHFDADPYWTESEHHKGWCCGSCEAEYEEGSGVVMDGFCCCHDTRIAAG